MQENRKGLNVFNDFVRGIILGFGSYFYIKAGVEENGQLIVNTDKAFDFIGDHLEHIYLLLLVPSVMAFLCLFSGLPMIRMIKQGTIGSC